MPFNPDGTMADGGNFTTPGADSNIQGNAGNQGGAGDQGQKWDPFGKRWIPFGQPGNMPAAPQGADGWSNVSRNNYGDGGNGGFGSNNSGQPDTTGKTGSPGAWGGYTGRMVDDGKGGVVFDGDDSGRSDAVNHLQGLANAASNQQAYQNDYSTADRFAQAGQQDRGLQVDAMRMAQDTAAGRNLQSQALGQSMLQQGVQAQQAGAASTRGGSLAQAAAMRQQAGGQAAFMQQGNTQLDAQRAAEMAQGRDAYMQQATGLRASDASAQKLNQDQGVSQMQNEINQRQLNQQGQMGYDSMAQDTNIGAANAAIGQHQVNAGIADTSMQRHQGKLDQGQQWVASGVSAAGSLGGSASGMGGGGGGGSTSSGPDPYSQAVSNSDARGKTEIRSLATAVRARGGMR